MNNLLRSGVAIALIPALLIGQVVAAATPTALTYGSINPVPPNVRTTPARPLIMLNMSRDHQLF